MNGVEFLGYLAAALVFTTFYMKTMLPLRVVAIASNLAFIGYAYFDHLHPVFLLHGILLPLNVIRLMQLVRLMRRVKEIARAGEFPVRDLLPYMKKRTLAAGTFLFHKGDKAEEMYYLAEGRVALEGIEKTLGAGEIMGEIGVFSPQRRRTVSAVAETDCVIYALTATAVRVLYYQNPRFGYAVLRLAVLRLVGDVSRLES
jgi:CRP/FNR family cyclic AMP-dependent transcriptional regulator